MVKALYVFSRCMVCAALCGVGALVVLSWYGEPEIAAFLQHPGVLDGYVCERSEDSGSNPLVRQLAAFAFRIDPPIRSEQVDENTLRKVTSGANEKGLESERINNGSNTDNRIIPDPMFELVGTAVCADYPERSLALIKTPFTFEWLESGQMLGHHQIDIIGEGRMTVTVNSQQQVLYMPINEVQSLLRD